MVIIQGLRTGKTNLMKGGIGFMVETKQSLTGQTLYKNAGLVTMETCTKLSEIGVYVAVNDGEYCSVTNE